MAAELNKFQEAVYKLLEVVMFENWLRFYFIREGETFGGNAQKEASLQNLRIEIPAKSMAKIKELYGDMYALAESMNNRPVDFETSRRAVLTHILENFDGKIMERGTAQSIFASRAFQTGMQLFHTWVQMHEEQLDKGFLDFGTWSKLFYEWKNTPAARELAAKLGAEPAGDKN